jgi:hypothetical protein
MQVGSAALVLEVSKLLCGEDDGVGGCLCAESSTQVLFAALDVAMTILGNFPTTAARDGGGDGVQEAASLLSAGFMLQRLGHWLRVCAARKAFVVAGLLQRERLRLWWECLDILQGGEVCLQVVSLLHMGVTKEGVELGGQGKVADLGITASQASEVSLMCVRSCQHLGPATGCQAVMCAKTMA